MEKAGRILIIDDDEDVLQAARLFLKQYVASVQTDRNPAQIPVIMKREAVDVVFLDMNFARGAIDGKEGFQWLRRILDIDPAAVVVMISAYGDIETAVRAIKEGATDFVLKPWQNEKLLATLSAALQLRRSRLETGVLRSRQEQLCADLDQPFHDFIGQSAAIREVFALVQKVAHTDANVLILGENGTGKELVARELHRHSPRARNVFISVDMGALSETLFESELFGHVRGAFTDARENRAGRFETASGGTLFLDEIGNLPLNLQAKLLRAIETRRVTRLGANAPVEVDVRLITATNMPIHQMVAEKHFRQDLLYRVNTVEIRLPPLRERIGDIPLLAEHFLRLYARKYGKRLGAIDAVTLRKLEAYPWPGNVRELQHAIERAVILGEAECLLPSDFYLTDRDAPPVAATVPPRSIEDAEKDLIARALQRHGGNVSHAAHELGLSRGALYRRMEKYAL